MLVDRLAAEPGSSVKFGAPGVDGFEIEAKVLAHRRGPRIEVLRYKSKKRVRVHRGARADLTALEIMPFGRNKKDESDEDAEETPKKGAARKPRAKKETKDTKAAKETKPAKETKAAKPAKAAKK